MAHANSRAQFASTSRFVVYFVLISFAVASAYYIGNAIKSRADTGLGLPAFSVYSNGDDGLAQAAGLLKKLGFRPVAVTRPIHQTRHRGLLVLVESNDQLAEIGLGHGLTPADVDGLLDWVAQGNTLLYVSSNNSLLHHKLGIRLKEELAPADTVFRAEAGAVGYYTAGVQHLGIESPNTLSGQKAVPLWWLGNRPAALAQRHGNGRVLLVADPSMLTHRGLLREDNALFLYNVAALDSVDGVVYFDEFHHGIRSGGGYWSYLRYHGQHWIVLQLLLIGGVSLWAVGRRLGPATPIPVVARADAVDYAASVARIYEKADARPLVAGIYALNFLDRITHHLRLRRGAPSTEVVAAWKQRYGDATVRELSQLLDAAQLLVRSELTKETQVLHLVKRFDAFLDQTKPKAPLTHRHR